MRLQVFFVVFALAFGAAMYLCVKVGSDDIKIIGGQFVQPVPVLVEKLKIVNT
jgi:hypothetical protein